MKRRKKSKTLLTIFFSYAFLLLLFYLLFAFHAISRTFFDASLYAVGLNFVNSILAISFFLFSIEGSNQKFIVMNLGGLGARVFLMVVSIIIILKFLKIDVIDFILVFFVFYFVQLILEIRFFHNFNNKK